MSYVGIRDLSYRYDTSEFTEGERYQQIFSQCLFLPVGAAHPPQSQIPMETEFQPMLQGDLELQSHGVSILKIL